MIGMVTLARSFFGSRDVAQEAAPVPHDDRGGDEIDAAKADVAAAVARRAEVALHLEERQELLGRANAASRAADEECAQLSAEADRIAVAAFGEDVAAVARLDVINARKVELATLLERTDRARVILTEEIEVLAADLVDHDRAIADGDLKLAALELQHVGARVDALFRAAASGLKAFRGGHERALDALRARRALGGESKLLLAEGRFLGERLIDALSHYFMGELYEACGSTDVHLDVTRERRHQTFDGDVSRLPFSPRPEEK